MDTRGKAVSFIVLVFAGCSDGSGIPANGGSGGAVTGGHGGTGVETLDASISHAEEDAVGAGGESGTVLDAATCCDAANAPPFTVYPQEIRWSGSAGYGKVDTITVRSNVDLTDLSATFSSGGNIFFVSRCPASLAIDETCTVSVTMCPVGTYSARQDNGEVLIRTGGEHSHSVTVSVHAYCYSS
jgi:hypothetical protein